MLYRALADRRRYATDFNTCVGGAGLCRRDELQRVGSDESGRPPINRRERRYRWYRWTGGGTGATAITSDDVFNDNDWDEVVQAFGAGGSGGAGQLHFNGQAAGWLPPGHDHGQRRGQRVCGPGRSVLLQAGSGVLPVDRRSDHLSQPLRGFDSASGRWKRPVQRTGDQAERHCSTRWSLAAGAFPTPEASWTPHSLSGLTQNDFRTTRVGCGAPGLLHRRWQDRSGLHAPALLSLPAAQARR